MKHQNARITALTGIAVGLLVFGLAACAPQTSSKAEGGAPEEEPAVEAVAVTWSPESDCSSCHAKQSESLAASVYGNCIANPGDSTCLSCHTDEAALSTVHEGATTDKKIPKRLKQTAVDAETCLACHQQDEIREATADSTALTDDHGTVVNPHDVMELTASHEGLACSSCHNPHDDGSIAETAQQTCQGCHHENVYECGTCHEKR